MIVFTEYFLKGTWVRLEQTEVVATFTAQLSTVAQAIEWDIFNSVHNDSFVASIQSLIFVSRLLKEKKN